MFETIHNLVEVEFYELESFDNKDDLFDKLYSYQLFFNLLRPNSYKENKTPWQLASEKIPNLSIDVAKIPPIDLSSSLSYNYFTSQVGHDVYSTPFFKIIEIILHRA